MQCGWSRPGTTRVLCTSLLLQIRTLIYRPIQTSTFTVTIQPQGWLGSRVVSVLDSGARRIWVQIAAATLSGNSLRQTVPTHHATVHQAAKLVATLKGCQGNCEPGGSNGSLPPDLWLTSPAGQLPRTGISSGTLRSAIEYGLPLPLLFLLSPEGDTHLSTAWEVGMKG